MEIFGILGFDTLFLIAFAVFYYKAADMADSSKTLWTGSSIIVSLAVRLLAWGLLGLILSQAILFFAIAAVRALLSGNRQTDNNINQKPPDTKVQCRRYGLESSWKRFLVHAVRYSNEHRRNALTNHEGFQHGHFAHPSLCEAQDASDFQTLPHGIAVQNAKGSHLS